MVTQQAGTGSAAHFAESSHRRPAGAAVVLSMLGRDKAALFSLAFLLVLGASCLLAPMIVGKSATKISMSSRFIGPGFSTGHLLGTDQLGRDILGRIVLATRVSLSAAIVVVAISLAFGAALGILAGYYGGRFDDVIMRVVDMAMGFPSLLLALVVIYALGANIVNLVIVLTATRWMLYTRAARAETMRLRSLQYIEAAQGIGGSDVRIMLKHILPNLLSVLFTLATLELGVVMLAESGLSFLGLGIQPPAASLGLLIAQGKEYITKAWWLIFFPGATIFLTAMAFNLLSNWLGIVLDPIQRWRLTAAGRQ